MRISTRARYGLRFMLKLALHYGKGVLHLKDIAQEENISEKYLSQLIMPLKANGLVHSVQGAKGGYLLARDPAEITIKAVVDPLETGLSLVDCSQNSLSCSRNSLSCDRFEGCVTKEVWNLLAENIAKTLNSITLATLVRSAKKIDKNNQAVSTSA